MEKNTTTIRPEELRNIVRNTAFIFPGILGGIFVLLGQNEIPIRITQDRYTDISLYFTISGGLLILLTCAMLTMMYLQTGFKILSNADKIRFQPTDSRFPSRTPDGKLPLGTRILDVDGILSDINTLRERVNHLETASTGNTDDQIAAASDQLTERVLTAGGEELLNRAATLLGPQIQKIQSFRTINDTFEESKERLFSEIMRLERKSNFNLTLGGLTTILGICLLGYSVFFH